MKKDARTTHKEENPKRVDRENELSNLEPMSSLQKGIIFFAILCIVGAIVYCVFFMR